MYFDIKPSIIDNISLEGVNPFYSTAWQKKYDYWFFFPASCFPTANKQKGLREEAF